MNAEKEGPSEEVVVSSAPAGPGEVTVRFQSKETLRRRPTGSSPTDQQPMVLYLDIVFKEEDMMNEIERIEKLPKVLVSHTGNIPSFRVTQATIVLDHDKPQQEVQE